MPSKEEVAGFNNWMNDTRGAKQLGRALDQMRAKEVALANKQTDRALATMRKPGNLTNFDLRLINRTSKDPKSRQMAATELLKRGAPASDVRGGGGGDQPRDDHGRWTR